MKVKKPLSSGA